MREPDMDGVEQELPRSRAVRLLWFVALWLAGVLVVLTTAYVIRLMLMPSG